MRAEIQNTKFTHGKCFKCGYLGLIDKFDSQKDNHTLQKNEDGSELELYSLVLKCPMCGDEFCEALFPNEVN